MRAPGQNRLQIGGGDGFLMERRRCRETPIELGNDLQGFALAAPVRVDDDWQLLEAADGAEVFWTVKPGGRLGEWQFLVSQRQAHPLAKRTEIEVDQSQHGKTLAGWEEENNPSKSVDKIYGSYVV